MILPKIYNKMMMPQLNYKYDKKEDNNLKSIFLIIDDLNKEGKYSSIKVTEELNVEYRISFNPKRSDIIYNICIIIRRYRYWSDFNYQISISNENSEDGNTYKIFVGDFYKTTSETDLTNVHEDLKQLFINKCSYTESFAIIHADNYINMIEYCRDYYNHLKELVNMCTVIADTYEFFITDFYKMNDETELSKAQEHIKQHFIEKREYTESYASNYAEKYINIIRYCRDSILDKK